MVLFVNINLMQGRDPSVLLGYELIMDITTFLPYLVCFFKDLHTQCPKKDPFSEQENMERKRRQLTSRWRDINPGHPVEIIACASTNK